MTYSKAQIQAVAATTLREHGMHLVAELKREENYGASNLIALMEIFAGNLLAATPIESASREHNDAEMPSGNSGA